MNVRQQSVLKWAQIINLNPSTGYTTEMIEEAVFCFEEYYKEKESNISYCYGGQNPGPLYDEVQDKLDKTIKVYEGTTTEYETYLKVVDIYRGLLTTVSSFTGGQYSQITIKAGTHLYRAGNKDWDLGSYWTLVKIPSVLQVRDYLALKRYWKEDGEFNKLSFVYEWIFDEDLVFNIGPVANQGKMYYGNNAIEQLQIDRGILIRLKADGKAKCKVHTLNFAEE